MSRALASAEPQVWPVAEDERFAVDGRVRHLAAYDAGRPAGPRPEAGPGTDLVAADIDTVIAALPGRLATVLAEHPDTRRNLLRQVRILLTWLQQFPGADWEQRWLASGVDCAPRSWTSRLVADAPGSPALFSGALALLLLARVLRPSYSFMLNVKFGELFTRFPLVHDSEDFARLRSLAPYRRAVTRAQIDAEAGLIRVLIRTGKSFGDVTAEDLLTYADLVKTSGRPRREHLLWELLVQAGPLAGEPMTLRAVWTAKGNSRQHDAAHVLDRYGLPPSPVRDVLIDYLTEIRPGLDYGSWVHHVHTLGRAFWWEVLQINPEQADLRLAPHVIAQWRERLAMTAAGGARRDVHSLLFRVRAFYRDLQQWALDEPARWGIWAVPSPVRDNDLRGLRKAKRHQQARTQQRTRVLTPLLPGLLAAATARRDWSVRLRPPRQRLPTRRYSTSTVCPTAGSTRRPERCGSPGAAPGCCTRTAAASTSAPPRPTASGPGR